MKKLTLLCILVLVSPVLAQDFPATVTVNISNLRNDDGQVVVLLFSSSDGFPMDQDKALQIETMPIEHGVAIVTFTDLSYGDYALLVIHDEDMNDELNTNFIGKPTEKCWVSNGQRGGPFGGPEFDASAFEVLTESLVINARFND